MSYKGGKVMDEKERVRVLIDHLLEVYKILQEMEKMMAVGILNNQRVCDGDYPSCGVMETEREREECPVIH